MRGAIGAVVAAATVALLGACSSEPGPYLEISGGGFIFNYRIAEATVGLVASARRTLPAGATIEARFENPAGGPPIVIAEPVSQETRLYEFKSPPLTGVRADRDYAVSVRLIAADGSEIEKIEKPFRSQLDQSVLPDKPLTIGPGYTRNPENAPAN